MSYVNIQSLSEANIIWLMHLNICKVSKFYTVKCWDLRGSLTITWKYTTWNKSDTAAAGIQCCCYGDVTLKIPWKTDGHPQTPTPTPTPTQTQTYTISLSRLIWRNREQQCTLFDILQTFRSNTHTHTLSLSLRFFHYSIIIPDRFSFSFLNLSQAFVSSSSHLSLSLSYTGCGCCTHGCQAVATEIFWIIDGACSVRPTKQHPNCLSRAQQAALLSRESISQQERNSKDKY